MKKTTVAPPPCRPTGDLRPWPDDRPRRCTLCGDPVTVRALADGSDWLAIDALGQAMGTEPVPELCPCYPLDDPLRTRGGKIVGPMGRSDVEIDEKSRHYGAGLWLTEWRGNFHTHDSNGGDYLYSSLASLPLACGHRLPPSLHAVRIEPLETDRACPECCGSPMRFAPRGWQCRVSGQYFTPTWED